MGAPSSPAAVSAPPAEARGPRFASSATHDGWRPKSGIAARSLAAKAFVDVYTKTRPEVDFGAWIKEEAEWAM